MKQGDVVMTVKPCRDRWGTKVRAGRIFLVCGVRCYIPSGRRGVHVDDEVGKARGWKFCLPPTALEILT